MRCTLKLAVLLNVLRATLALLIALVSWTSVSCGLVLSYSCWTTNAYSLQGYSAVDTLLEFIRIGLKRGNVSFPRKRSNSMQQKRRT